MASENQVTLVGNLTADPELRFTPSGAAVANFTVAVNKRQRNQDGSWEDKLDGFFRCSCWREMAENVADLTKGTRVVVVGRLTQRDWQDKEGNNRQSIEIQVDEVGPSLRWAKAQVVRPVRESSGGSFDNTNAGFGGGQPSQQFGGQQAPQQAQPQVGQAPAQQPPADDWGAGSAIGGQQMDEGGF